MSRLARARRFVKRPGWPRVVTVVLGLCTVGGFVVGMLTLLADGSSGRRDFRLMEASRTGPLAVAPSNVRCRLRARDLPPPLREGAPPVSGQLCVVRAKIQNEAKNQEPAGLRAILYVGRSAYENVAAAPEGPDRLGILSPGEEVVVNYVFVLAREVSPTRLTFQANPQATTVAYDIRGVI